ncbi:MAG: Gfo/Idh/MocA family oxidoreductase [Planctomycetales bacterium]|nr:Gfo/Idh/MocA family oxidoreductase [Planctomycetales bacterium]
MNLTPEEREVGRDNYYDAVTQFNETTRRGFLQQVILAGGATAAGLGALYFGYDIPRRPVRIGIIGTGDEGNVLIGALNPYYVEVAAICDIRPSSVYRAFNGDWATPNTIKVRPGLNNVYGWSSEEEARKHVKVTSEIDDILDDPSIQGVIIALPLHLHAPVAVKAMLKGKHVLVEKLMAHNVAQCKWMGRVSEATKKLCSTGHQRHYSILYDNAVNLIRWGLLGQIHHIRAQWHRGNLPGSDTWAMPIPGGESYVDTKGESRINDPIVDQILAMQNDLLTSAGRERDQLLKRLEQWQAWDRDKTIDPTRYGYESIDFAGRNRSAIEELVRWRIWERTGGGLMAELGSHQLDAASIFISAMSKDKVHPLTVHAVGGRHIFPEDRDADDHVYCMFEFPGPSYSPDFKVGYRDVIRNFPDKGIQGYDENPERKVVVSYSSINGNGFGGYGEVVMGTKGTLVLDTEKEVMIYPGSSTSTRAGVRKERGGSAALDTSASGDTGPAKTAESSGPVSRGYKEEIEHWAWCIASGDWSNQPRCNPKVALADAVIALTTKLAIANNKRPNGSGYIPFDEAWFDLASDAVPELLTDPNGPSMQSEKANLGVPGYIS